MFTKKLAGVSSGDNVKKGEDKPAKQNKNQRNKEEVLPTSLELEY